MLQVLCYQNDDPSNPSSPTGKGKEGKDKKDAKKSDKKDEKGKVSCIGYLVTFCCFCIEFLYNCLPCVNFDNSLMVIIFVNMTIDLTYMKTIILISWCLKYLNDKYKEMSKNLKLN